MRARPTACRLPCVAPNRETPLSGSACLRASFPVGCDPHRPDDALAGHACALTRVLDGGGRGGVEQAEHELVARQVERSPEDRVWPLSGLASRPRCGEPELVLGHAGPEALGR